MLRNRISNFFKHLVPASIYCSEQEIKVLTKIQQKLTLLEDNCREETILVKQALDDYKCQLNSAKVLSEHLLSLQDQLDQLTPIAEDLHNIQRIIHRRSDRLETCMIHCLSRANLSFEIALAEHCNLNCAGCDHFSPLAKPEYADLESMTRDFARLSKLFHGCAEEIHLLGENLC